MKPGVHPVFRHGRTPSWVGGVLPSTDGHSNPRNDLAHGADISVENKREATMRLVSTPLSIAMLLAAACLDTGCAVTSWLSSSRPTDLKPKEPIALEERIAEDGNRPNGQVDHFAVLI